MLKKKPNLIFREAKIKAEKIINDAEAKQKILFLKKKELKKN